MKLTPAEYSRLQAKVAEASGRAADATQLTNTYLMVEGAGRVDPIAEGSR
jgi:hypothetical protein